MVARDGSFISLWQDVAPYQTLRPALQGNTFDVGIVGGGITGITTALLLQKAGRKCIVFEANNLGFGTTGGTTAHLNTILDTPYHVMISKFSLEYARLVRKSVREAIDLIKSNIESYGIDCEYDDAVAYLFSQNTQQTEELHEIYNACKEVSQDVHYSEDVCVPIPFEKAVAIPSQGKLHPLKYLHGIALQFEEAGGVIVQNCRVTDRKEDNGSINLTTQAGDYRVKDLVYATHIPPGVNLLHLRCTPWRSYAMAVNLADNNYPKDLAYDMYDPYHYYRTQKVDGVPYLIVGGEDHRTGDNENTESSFMHLEGHVRKYFNVREVVFRWSSQFFESADGLPYIGQLPGAADNVYVATGYGGNGMVYSNVAAKTLCDLIVKKESEYKAVYSPSRIKPAAGFKNFVENNAEVAKHFLGKWFSVEKLNQLADLAPGEGRVIKYEGHQIAISKDSDGALIALSATCTHLGCNVSWNVAEQTWDCPCHGARYSPAGKVLNGPATKDLEVIELRSLSGQVEEHEYQDK